MELLREHKYVDNILYLFCNKCKEYKCIDEFYTRGKEHLYHTYCKECMKKDALKYKKDKPENVKKWQKKANKNRNHSREWKILNGDDKRYKVATPTWVDMFLIRDIYLESLRLTQITGIQYSVDHIIPLKAKDDEGNHIACGLHVPWNLCVMPLILNIKKNCYLKNSIFLVEDIVYTHK